MRKLFTAYIPRDEAAFSKLWQASEFTFDANVLLDLYSASAELRQSFIEQLTAIKDRIFLTHQAGLEFYRNRREVHARAFRVLDSVTESLSVIPAAVSENSAKQLTEILTAERKNVKEFLRNDPVEGPLAKLLENKVDEPYNDVQSKYPEIDQRYANRIPPGYSDDKAKEDYRKYGDAILWLQVIDHARITKRPVILITAEKKGDWWLKSNEGLTVGPRPELEQEIAEKAHVEFYLYSFKQFMQFAPTELKTKPTQKPEESAQEIDKLEKQKDELLRDYFADMQRWRNQWAHYHSPNPLFEQNPNAIWSPALSNTLNQYGYVMPTLTYLDSLQKERRIEDALRTLDLYAGATAPAWGTVGSAVQNALRTLREELAPAQWPSYIATGPTGISPVGEEKQNTDIAEEKAKTEPPGGVPQDMSQNSAQTAPTEAEPLNDESTVRKKPDSD